MLKRRIIWSYQPKKPVPDISIYIEGHLIDKVSCKISGSVHRWNTELETPYQLCTWENFKGYWSHIESYIRTNLGQSCIIYRGPKIWNSIINDKINGDSSEAVFSKMVKQAIKSGTIDISKCNWYSADVYQDWFSQLRVPQYSVMFFTCNCYTPSLIGVVLLMHSAPFSWYNFFYQTQGP